jgi:hypothetical protein
VLQDRHEIMAHANRQRIDLERTITVLKSIEAQTGYPLLIDIPEHLMSLL